MPSYTKAAGHPVKAVVAGFSTYLFGNWQLDVAPTRFLINNVAITSNVATITGTVIEGNIPTVPSAGQPSSLISISGTQTSSGVFNVSGVAISAVSINATTGIGTISFPLTNANITAVADAGVAIIPVPETADALTANGASIPCTVPVQDPKTDGARTINCVCEFPSIPTAVTIKLQGAQYDQDSEYADIGTVATVAASAVTQSFAQFTLNMAKFYRFNASGISGTGTIIGKILF